MTRSRVAPELDATMRVALVTSRVNTFNEWLQLFQHIVTLGTLGATVAGLWMLSVYLIQIGRRDLLLQVVATPSGLVTIVLLAVVLSLSLLVMFFASPLFIDMAAALYRNKPRLIPKAMPQLLIVGSVAWCALVGGCFGCPWFGKHLLIVIAIYLVGLIVAATYLQHQAWRRFPQFRRMALLTGFAVGVAFALALIFSLYAPWAFLEIDPAFGKQGVAFWPTVLLVVTMTPELFLGCALFWGVARKKGHADTRLKVGYTVLMLAVAGLAVTFRPMDLLVLRALGVYETGAVDFMVADAGIKPGLVAAGIEVGSKEDGAEGFRALVKFHFGGHLVLCAAPPVAHAPADASPPGFAPKVAAPALPPQTPRETAAPKKPCLDVQETDVRRRSKNLPTEAPPGEKAKAPPVAALPTPETLGYPTRGADLGRRTSTGPTDRAKAN